MKYTGSVCDGCGLVLKEDDDVVVCPECGTPQHRECYKKENRCVNYHRHSENFEWTGSFSPMPAPAENKATQEEMLPCPSCGHLNPRDAKRCESCSMKLIVFGMNLAEATEEQKPERHSSEELPDYKAPFTLGQGDGFNNSEENEQTPPQMPFTSDIAPDGQMPYPPQGYMPPEQQGYMPPEPRLRTEAQSRENAKQYLLFRFLGSNAGKFMNAFRKIDSGRGFTFNWAALFFGPYWFFYRKLYKPGIIFMTLSAVISVIFTPTLNRFAEITEAYRVYGDALYTDEAVIESFMSEILPLYPTVIAFFAANIAIALLAALIAYPLYKKHAEGSVDRIMSAPSSEIGMALVSKLGGTSFIAPFALYFIMNILLSFAEGIIYG